MVKKRLNWILANKIHFVVWFLFIIYEWALVGLMNKLYPHPLVDPLHFLINICFFYVNAHYTLPFFLKKKRGVYLLLPGLILQIAVYILLHFSLDKILIATEVIQLKKVYVLNWAVVIRNLYRGIYFLGFSTGYYFLRNYIQERKRAEELEQDKLKAIIKHQQMQQELTNAQNAFLKAQINPHFLFNTLDFVYHNVNKHSPMAGEAVARLAEMMRFAIAAGEREQHIRLGDEIEQVENLIFLYQIRKNNGLAISFNYPQEALELKIIPLVLLTLVENVFKHGYLTSNEKDLAEIKLSIDNEVLTITTTNTIGRLQTLMSNKTGLKNVDERLGFAYGKNYAFNHEAKGSKFLVVLSIPISLLQHKPAVAKHATNIDIV